MAEQLKPPYIKKIDARDGLIAWAVDGSYIRSHVGEEFTNFGQHYRLPEAQASHWPWSKISCFSKM
jgi:hypothetical protein